MSRQSYYRNLAKGVCPNCGGYKDRQGTLCSSCVESAKICNARKYRQRVNAGLCGVCGKVNHDRYHRLCDECRTKARDKCREKAIKNATIYVNRQRLKQSLIENGCEEAVKIVDSMKPYYWRGKDD